LEQKYNIGKKGRVQETEWFWGNSTLPLFCGFHIISNDEEDYFNPSFAKAESLDP
jgi:hypothetical protein